MARARHFGAGYSYFGEDYSAGPTGAKGMDVKAFGDSSGKYVFWDASADTLYVVGSLSLDGTFAADNIAFADAETLTFGTGSDVVMQWDGTNFIIAAAADDSLIEIGDSAATQKSFDVKWYANEANGASYLYFDAGSNLIYTTGVDLQFKDNDYLVFGTGSGASGDINMVWNGSSFLIAGVAASSTTIFGGSANIIDLNHYGDLSGFNNEADATGYTITARKSRGPADTALNDNDVVFQITGEGLNDNATPAAKTLANIKILMTDASDTTEDGAIVFEVMVAGAAAAEKLRIADIITASAVLQLGSTATAALTMGGGISGTPLTTATADKNFLGFWTESTATSGDSRGLYLRHYLGGTIAATGYGDAIRAFCTVTGTGYSYASGLHGTMQINADATVTGSGSGIRATLAAAADTRTLDGALSALHLCSDIATGNTVPTVHGFLRCTDDGAVRFGNFAVIPNVENGTIFAAHTTQGLTHSIKIISEDGTAYYIMCTDAATNRS